MNISFNQIKNRIVLLFLFVVSVSFSQRVCNEFYYQKFSKEQLEQDIDFIREKILNAHVNPFTEISKEEFEKKYEGIKNSLKVGMTQREFYYLAKPLIVTLNDEHSGMNDFCVTDSIKTNFKVFPLRFNCEKGKMLLTENFSEKNIAIGDELISLNDIPINEVLESCAQTVSGTKDERIPFVVDKFWIVINKFCYFLTDDYKLKFKSGLETVVKSISYQQLSEKTKQSQSPKKEDLPVSYKKVEDFGYLTISTFNDRKTFPLDQWKVKFDSIFTQIKKDKVKKLVIDVHNNSGGNSAIGNLLINYFSDKSYSTYQGTFKKSQEYLDFMKKRGIEDSAYEKLENGDYYPIKSRKIKPSKNKNQFNGKTYVVVGKNTFSSAMMFGTIVLDNKLATLIGEIPEKGHPNHFGELIFFQTPNTKLDFFFGVKEWIRPAGNILPNKLIPDKIIDLKDKTEQEIIKQL